MYGHQRIHQRRVGYLQRDYWVGISIDSAIDVSVADGTNHGLFFIQHLLQLSRQQVTPTSWSLGRRGRCGRTCWVLRCSRRAPTSTPGSQSMAKRDRRREPRGQRLVERDLDRDPVDTRAGEHGGDSYPQHQEAPEIYRSISSQSGQGTYFLVDEFRHPGDYVDTVLTM